MAVSGHEKNEKMAVRHDPTWWSEVQSSTGLQTMNLQSAALGKTFLRLYVQRLFLTFVHSRHPLFVCWLLAEPTAILPLGSLKV
jgi:hypothetical protein